MLSSRLSQLREERGLKRNKIAEILNIDKSTYGNYELSKRQPDYNILEKIASFYDVSIDYLLGRTDERNSSTGNAIVGERIRNARLSKNMTQEDVAGKVGLSADYYAGIELGIHTIEMKILF